MVAEFVRIRAGMTESPNSYERSAFGHGWDDADGDCQNSRAEALIATAMGLFAAIPAVIAYNRYSNQVDRLITRYDNFVEEFTALLQRQAITREAEAAARKEKG